MTSLETCVENARSSLVDSEVCERNGHDTDLGDERRVYDVTAHKTVYDCAYCGSLYTVLREKH